MTAERIVELWRARCALDAKLAEQVGVFHSQGGCAADGQLSTVAWLRAFTRMSPETASKYLSVGRHRDALSDTVKALGVADISLEHAAAITRLADHVGADKLAPEGEEILPGLAREDTPGAVRRAAKHLRHLINADDADGDAKRLRDGRYVSMGRTFGGAWSLQGLLDPVAGEVVKAALDAATPPPCDGDDRSAQQRRADGLTDLAQRALGVLPEVAGQRPHVLVTINYEALRTQLAAAGLPLAQPIPGSADSSVGAAGATDEARTTGIGDAAPIARGAEALGQRYRQGRAAELGSGEPIPASLARMLACDAKVIPVVLGSAGELLDVGRASHSIPTAIRRALNLRDGGCRFPGCDRPPEWCDAHHVVHWADGGDTSLPNLVLLCRAHHTLTHQGWHLHHHEDGTITAQRPNGTELGLVSTGRRREPP